MTGGASLFNLLASVARVKVMALLVGTAGIGIVSYLINFVQLTISVTGLGIGSGVVKLTGEYAGASREEEINRLKATSFSTTFWLAVLVNLTMFVFAKGISVLLAGNAGYASYIRVLSFSIPCLTLSQAMTSVLNGFKAIREMALITSWSALIGLVFVVPLVWKFQVKGVVCHFVLMAIVAMILTLVFYRRRMKDPYPLRFLMFHGFDRRLVRALAAFGIATFLLGVFQNLAFLIVRKWIQLRFGQEGVGLYQVPYGLTLQYLNIVLTALLTYSLSTMSGIREESALRDELNHTMRASLLVIVPIIAFLLVFKKYLVLLLYSREFLPSIGLLEIQLLGDFFKVIAFVFGVAVLARARLVAWLMLDLLWDGLFVAFSYFLVPHRGLAGIAVAFAGAYFLMAAGYGLFMWRSMALRLTASNLKLIVLSFAALVGIVFFTRLGLEFALAGTAGILVMWVLLSFRQNEIRMGWRMLRNLSWGDDDPLSLK